MSVLSVDEGSPSASTPLHTRVRADALPEHTRYQDDGCDAHPYCLTCPLPHCRYDEPGGLRALLNARRDRQIVELRLRGATVGDLAGRFGVSRRTVFRILSTGSRQALGSRGRRGWRNGHRSRLRTPSIGATLHSLRKREAQHA